MSEKRNIKILLEKFHHGLTTPEENMQLQRLLNENSVEVDELAQAVWDQEPITEGAGSSARILEQLHQKLDFDKQSTPAIKKLQSSKVLLFITRYAAIFIIGFAISWLLFKKDGENSAIKESTAYYKIKVAYGSKSTVELPDGSIATLNSGSTLSYPGSFTGKNRMVMLDGEAFFDVKKDPSHPFLVKTKDITVKVLGTKFNVKSYADDNLTETTLVTGKVEISRNGTDKNNSKQSPLVLAPNQKAVFIREDNQITLNDIDRSSREKQIEKLPAKMKVIVQKEIKTEMETSWKNNILVFNSEPFGDIIKKLERWYNVEVTLKYPKLSPVVFSGKFDRESVQEVLHALSLIEPFKYEVNKNSILIYK